MPKHRKEAETSEERKERWHNTVAARDAQVYHIMEARGQRKQDLEEMIYIACATALSDEAWAKVLNIAVNALDEVKEG